MSLQLRYAALSDVGRVRRDNQDSGYAGPHLLVIADGVGGAARGDIASSATVEAISKLDVPPGNDALSELSATLHLAHDRLAEIVEQHPDLDGTSTTVTAAIFDGTHLRVGHVGDSRGYLLRDGGLSPITTDHTLVQSLIDEGRITEAEARVHPHRNLILRAVDGVHEPEPDLFSEQVRAGDRILFCSDGCSGVLENETMASLLAGDDLTEVTRRLVRSALDAGSSDNVTVVVAEVVETDEQLDPAPVVVGAAATAPHLRIDDATGNLTETDVAALGDEEVDDDLDPEEIRYAPRAPRRYTWLRRAVVVVILLGLALLGGRALYNVSQDQYYVSDDAGEVVIFRGVDVEVPGIDTHHVVERTGVMLDELESYDANQVRDGIGADSMADARRIVEDLRVACPEPAVAPTPTPTPTQTPTLTPTPTPAPTKTPATTPGTPGATPPATTPATTPATPGATTTPDPCAETP
ncbi:PP2C family protein-serine/threonine phosphatase [Marmoricola sp. RAF53]|uniref:PP2C family protein-serine/threonine phosphatase n=1 Tax=Marmoricola sp. RAF53 TaxID=3233059 RepID=UPI003F99C7FA